MRREFVLDEVPAVAPARMSAISKYVLNVNGLEVARGPVRANPNQQPADDLDLAPYLRQGRNVIGVMCCRYDGPMAWWMPLPASPFQTDIGAGGFVFEANLAEGGWVVTDDAWSGTTLDGWGSTAGSVIAGRGLEVLYAGTLPSDWCDSDGADPSWGLVVCRRAVAPGESGHGEPPSYPCGPLGVRPISWPTANLVSLTRIDDDAFATDQIVAGTLVLDLEAPVGSVVTVRAAEFADPDGRPRPEEHDAGVQVITDGTRRLVESMDAYGLRGVVIEATDEVTVHSVGVRERLYPVTGSASFECSDPRLSRIWAVGRRTVTLCSFDAYLDCPTREQRAWVGDAVVHQMVDLTTNGDWGLARWYPKMAGSPRSDGMLPMAVAGDVEFYDLTIIPDWALHWIHAVWNLYRYVGDPGEIAELMPVAERVLRWFTKFCDSDGLPVDVVGWVLIDWASVYTDGVSASLCGLWARGLLEFAEMAEWLDDRGRAAWARATHDRLKAGFEKLWDPKRGRYADAIVADERLVVASQHGQASAIVGGLVPPSRLERLVEVLVDGSAFVDAAFSSPTGPATPNSDAPVGGSLTRDGLPQPWWDVDALVVRAQPFFRYVVHDALVAAGRPELIADLCLDWTTALERCDTSWTETWYGGTVSHAWSSTPTRDLMTYVLGVEPAEPGFHVARVDPHLGSLEWARGGVPTPSGLLHIELSSDGVEIESPIPFDYLGQRYPAGLHSLPRA